MGGLNRTIVITTLSLRTLRQRAGASHGSGGRGGGRRPGLRRGALDRRRLPGGALRRGLPRHRDRHAGRERQRAEQRPGSRRHAHRHGRGRRAARRRRTGRFSRALRRRRRPKRTTGTIAQCPAARRRAGGVRGPRRFAPLPPWSVPRRRRGGPEVDGGWMPAPDSALPGAVAGRPRAPLLCSDEQSVEVDGVPDGSDVRNLAVPSLQRLRTATRSGCRRPDCQPGQRAFPVERPHPLSPHGAGSVRGIRPQRC